MTKEVKIGDRIKLVHTDDKFVQLRPGDLGTVWNISIFNIEVDGKPVRDMDLLGLGKQVRPNRRKG